MRHRYLILGEFFRLKKANQYKCEKTEILETTVYKSMYRNVTLHVLSNYLLAKTYCKKIDDKLLIISALISS
jgi:hypothetical protein